MDVHQSICQLTAEIGGGTLFLVLFWSVVRAAMQAQASKRQKWEQEFAQTLLDGDQKAQRRQEASERLFTLRCRGAVQ